MYIKKRRNELGITQKELGKRVGVSRIAVHKWEQGYAPRVKLLPKVADALECTVNDVLDGIYNDEKPD